MLAHDVPIGESLLARLGAGAECRRRSLPAACAMILLAGGMAAALLNNAMPVYWAGFAGLLTIADLKLFRRLDEAAPTLTRLHLWLLGGWTFAHAAFLAVLPGALWLDATPAAMVAASVLWIAGAVRQMETALDFKFATLGAAPFVISLIAAPLMKGDLALAAIMGAGGCSLICYAGRVRISSLRAAFQSSVSIFASGVRGQPKAEEICLAPNSGAPPPERAALAKVA